MTLLLRTLFILSVLTLPWGTSTLVFAVPGSSNDGQIETHADNRNESSDQEQFSQTETNKAIERYIEQIKLLESEYGAYNIDLSESLTGLGMAYISLGNYNDALDVYSRALHINRVNNGLENLGQIATLERMIEVNGKKGDWGSAAKNYDYLLWLYNRNYERNDPDLIPILYRAANWSLETYENLPGNNSTSFLLKAAYLFNEIINMILITKGINDPQLITALYGIANTNVQLIRPYGKINLNNINLFTGSSGNLLPRNFAGVSQSRNATVNDINRSIPGLSRYDQQKLSNLLRRQEDANNLITDSYRSGKNALLRIVDIYENNPSLPKESYAEALTHLGDWYLRFRKGNTAIEYYQKAHDVLTQNELNSRYIDHLFGKPQLLDAIDYDTGQKQKDQEKFLEGSSFAELKFDVSESGSVRKIEIIKTDPDNVSFRRMVKDRIRFTPFRPRFEDGKPVSTSDVKMLYRFK